MEKQKPLNELANNAMTQESINNEQRNAVGEWIASTWT